MRTERPAECARNCVDRGEDNVTGRARGSMSVSCLQPPRLWQVNGDRTIAEVAYRLPLRLHHSGIILKALAEFGRRLLRYTQTRGDRTITRRLQLAISIAASYLSNQDLSIGKYCYRNINTA